MTGGTFCEDLKKGIWGREILKKGGRVYKEEDGGRGEEKKGKRKCKKEMEEEEKEDEKEKEEWVCVN